MAVVKKLFISGIRSFSPNDNKEQLVEFQTPLHIILGVNGSGKTTIIESLKYAVTNTLPPNCNKGSSFVNDPKLTNGYESMGSVKLELMDSRGNKILTTRKLKVSVKDKYGNLKKKELDATVKITDTKGKTIEVNSKCHDTKFEMTRIMGVSEAILNNVIFCHQEDSCWPLDEGKKVKEKFDAIFNTTAYIKCLDVLEKKDKDLGQRAKSEKDKLGYVEDNRKMALRKRKELENKEIELMATTDSIEKQEKDIKEMETRLRQLQELERESTEIEKKVSVVEGQLKATLKQTEETKSQIKELWNGDMASLESALGRAENEKKEKSIQHKQLAQKLRVKEDDLKRLSLEQSKLLVEEGKFQQEEQANRERLRSVANLVSDLSKTMRKLKEHSQDTNVSTSIDSCIENVESYSGVEEGVAGCSSVLKSITSVIKYRDAEISRVKSKFEQEEKELQKAIDELRSKRASAETELEMKQKQIKENVVQINDLKQRLREIEGSNSALEMLQEKQNQFESDIAVINDSGVITKCESEAKRLMVEIKRVDEHLNEANNKVELLAKDKGTVDQIAIFSKQKVQKQTEYQQIVSRIEDDMQRLLGKEISEEEWVETFEEKRISLSQELAQKESDHRDLERNVAVQESEWKRIKQELSKKQKKLDESKERLEDIDSILDGKDFDEAQESMKQEIETLQKDSYYAEAAVYLWKKFIQKLNKSDCCPLCKRDIESKRQTQEVINQIQADIKRSQEMVPANNPKIEKLKKQLTLFEKLRPVWDEKRKLEQEVPEIMEKATDLESKVADLLENLEDSSLLVSGLRHDKSSLDNRSKDVALLEHAKREIKQKQEAINGLERSRNEEAKRLSETLNLSAAKTNVQELRNSLKTKQMEKDNQAELLNSKRTELNKLTDKKNATREKVLRITAELQNREALEEQKKEIESANVKIQEACNSLKSSLPGIKSEITNSEKSKATFVGKKEQTLNQLRHDRDNLEKQKFKLEEISRKIEEFEDKKAQFENTKKRSEECKRKLAELEAQKIEIEKALESVTHEIANHETHQRNLRDNLSYKKQLEDVAKFQAELAEKKKLFDSTKNRGAATERRELSQKHHEKSQIMNQLKGGRTQIQTSMQELRKELKEPQLANAEQQYIEKLALKTVYEKAQKDIRRYRVALDQAIMAFHRQRMEMINKSLYEYWRRIYKGNDIDFIQIRTEAAAAPGATTNSKVKIDSRRKVYNYRVVMVRRGTELDMRGRCSAGQRVLASIIIRIALADSFSSRCGIITLDEPTTNLDQKNINSLAEALGSLAERMSEQKSFQLIVITHDQEFTERLCAIDVVEKYSKVSRDNMGFSQVQMVNKGNHRY